MVPFLHMYSMRDTHQRLCRAGYLYRILAEGVSFAQPERVEWVRRHKLSIFEVRVIL